MVECLIAFGGNMGAPEETWSRLPELLRSRDLAVTCMSRLHLTRAAGGPPGQPDFFNGVLRCRTGSDAGAVISALLDVERHLGRVRERRHGPRTADLDLLLFGDEVIDRAGLRVPHPRMAWRKFVIGPAYEAAPDWRHPEIGLTMRELFYRLTCLPRWITLVRPTADQACNLWGTDRDSDGADTGMPEEIQVFGTSRESSAVQTGRVGRWICWCVNDLPRLQRRAGVSPLLVWDSRASDVLPRDVVQRVRQQSGAVMDLAGEDQPVWNSLAAAVRAMEG